MSCFCPIGENRDTKLQIQCSHSKIVPSIEYFFWGGGERVGRIANSEYPYHEGAVWSEFALFTQIYLSKILVSLWYVFYFPRSSTSSGC